MPAVTLLLLPALLLAASDAPLADGAMKADRGAVNLLLSQKADVNAAQGDGMTALHWAAFNDDFAMAGELIRNGANVHAATRDDALTPLFLACKTGDAALVHLLLQAGADPSLANASGTTPLMEAAASGSAATINLLLDSGANPNAKENSQQETALFFAAAQDRADVIRALAAHGAQLEVTSKVTQLTPEKLSVDDEDFPLDAEVILHDNLPPGEKAAKAALAGRRATAQATGGATALLIAARDGHLAAVRALLESGANPNQPGASDRTTPLVIAAINGHWIVAKFLLEHGANPNLANADGLAALYATIDAQWAPLGGASNPDPSQEKITYLELMKVLLEHGANPNARLAKKLWFRPTAHDQMWVGTPGSTAFWRAAQSTDIAAMRLLIAHGADPKISSEEGDTPLMMAAGVGWAGNFSRNAEGPALAAVKYCVELGNDVNAQDVTGYTALGGAAWRGDNDSVKFLIASGAKLDVRTYRGWSVTDMANGPSLRTTVPVPHPDTIALLRKLGAPPLTNLDKQTILGLGSEHRQLPKK